MAMRKTNPSLLYTEGPVAGWARVLEKFIDDSLAPLCIRQWQRAPLTIQHRSAPLRRPR